MPNIADYDEALLSPSSSLLPAHLKQGQPLQVRIGPRNQLNVQLTVPWSKSGCFAVVFQLDLQNGERKALRCFLTTVDQSTRNRYRSLSRFLREHAAEFTVPFEFYEQGIKVKNEVQPLLEMDFVDGRTLVEEVACLCEADNRRALDALRTKWRDLIQQMDRIQMAHGCLCGDDVLVRSDGMLMLIDYDGVYFPDSVLTKFPSHESGNPFYQHPDAATDRKYDERMDDFSALAIYVALLSFAEDPSLFARFGSARDGKLLYEPEDLEQPFHSPVFQELRKLRNQEVQRLLPVFQKACTEPIDNVPQLLSLAN